jgi:hypothetical protein
MESFQAHSRRRGWGPQADATIAESPATSASCLTVAPRAKSILSKYAASAFKDPDSGKTLILLTNNTALPALIIAALYKSPWQVELFFKWIKQHLRIKRFLATSENAVKTQMVRDCHLRIDRNHQQRAETRCFALYLFADSVGLHLRKTEISCALQHPRFTVKYCMPS